MRTVWVCVPTLTISAKGERCVAGWATVLTHPAQPTNPKDAQAQERCDVPVYKPNPPLPGGSPLGVSHQPLDALALTTARPIREGPCAKGE